MKYSNGNEYDGDWKNGVKHGKGILTSENGDIYNGHWHENQINGYGKMIFKNGNIFKGRHPGEVYEGNWKDFNMHGSGKLLFDSKVRFDGQWNNGVMILGKYHYDNGDLYEGQFKDELSNNGRAIKEGIGKILYNCGEIYEGGWKNDQKSGYGNACYVSSGFGGAVGIDQASRRMNDNKNWMEYWDYRYSGSWEDDLWNGAGRLESITGFRCRSKYNSDRHDNYDDDNNDGKNDP